MSTSKTRLYIGRLSSRTRQRDLEDQFAKYGRIVRCDLKYNYAFVEYDDPRDADDAVRELDGTTIDGSKISVEYSRGTPGRNGRDGGRDGGGWDTCLTLPYLRLTFYFLCAEVVEEDAPWEKVLHNAAIIES
eukprot:TRINITY_DN206_c0_g1_i13.p1 TRINITY_DN206_c0_g1~~TRINITY_DN206_c0_g1_i13.p1  ORF type:complete len:132 (-),score=13.62 TRINITY_DN206_c0_g1_i13:803-1198(-)